MPDRTRSRTTVTTPVHRWWARVLATVMLTWPAVLTAQGHDHGSHTPPPADARLTLLLGGPHLLLYHRGYLALDDAQVAGLQVLRRTVCDAEVVYVEQAEQWHQQITELLGDAVSGSPRSLPDAMARLATAEAQWLTTLMQTRRDALALLSISQRVQSLALRDHWVRESAAMISEATRPGQRGHPGLQLPIRVPAMVVGATTLLPYCDVLHGPASHISMPPPR
jgi:hypothetical protein